MKPKEDSFEFLNTSHLFGMVVLAHRRFYRPSSNPNSFTFPRVEIFREPKNNGFHNNR